MNRKKFLSSIITAGAAIPAFGSMGIGGEDDLDKPIIIPNYLQPGDVIGITCPAGFITDKEIQSAVEQMRNWGFNIKVGDTVNKKDFTFGGTDEQRATDFQQMLDERSVKAIMCARGGYGSIRIIDNLDFTYFAKHPKWVIGFSDITVMHSHLNRNFNIASIHSKMCNSFPDDWTLAEPTQIDSILSIKQALTGERLTYDVLPNSRNKTGIAEGPLVGGNLKTLESLAGTQSDIKTAGKILFLEDTGEYLYSTDRMFWNLKRTDKLSHLKGLIVGGFKSRPDDPGEEFGKTLYDLVLEKIREYDFPVCFDFPVGHQKNNFAIKCGIRHRMKVSVDGVLIEELTPNT
jgi:muramoyltetrapeptide carboxypeptidase